MQTITLELPDSLYRSVTQIARVTKRPLAEILQESLNHTLPPLDDVDSDEADILAQLSALDDAALWHEFQSGIVEKEQDLLDTLLDGQNAGNLTSEDQQTLAHLLDQYGRLLVRKSHAMLLLARRGYRVPVQTPTTSTASLT